MNSLLRSFRLAPESEITLEINPDDVTRLKLNAYRSLGFNRVSVGVQSFDDKALRFLRRRHNARLAEEALEGLRLEGFNNIGVDLIYGIPGQTEADWVRTLERAMSFGPEHLSCYNMTIEEGTPFGNLHAEGRLKTPGEERDRALFLLTSRFLEERGYIHYEVSNFARGEGFASRHNQKYWRHAPYLGLGPAAHSYRDGVRWWNVGDIETYCRWISEGDFPVEDRETLSEEQIRLEALFLGFRTRRGVACDRLRPFAGWKKVVAQLERSGLARDADGMIVPTREGFLVADSLPLLFCA